MIQNNQQKSRLVPQKIFLTKGIGRHRDKLLSFELALREAGIEKCNLVTVSSIFPPRCKFISKEEGVKLLRPGQITFCVMSRNQTNKDGKLIASSVGLALPKQKNNCGYLSEYHCENRSEKNAGNYAQELAEIMLSTIQGKDCLERTDFISGAARGKNNLWTTTISVAVFV
jgi:arginine decarboxylase